MACEVERLADSEREGAKDAISVHIRVPVLHLRGTQESELVGVEGGALLSLSEHLQSSRVFLYFIKLPPYPLSSLSLDKEHDQHCQQ